MATPPDRTRRRLFTPVTRGAKQAAIILAVIMVALTAGNYLLASSAVRKATANAVSVQQLCQSGNEFRAEQVSLWMYLISLSPPPPGETPAARAQRVKTIQAFTAYIHQVFAPRNC